MDLNKEQREYIPISRETDKTPVNHSIKRALVACLFLISVAFWSRTPLQHSNCPHHSDQPEGDLQWKPLTSQKIYHANITLPLDYNEPSVGNVTIALAKYPADDDKEKLGTILINPGGPGGSGTNLVYRKAANISQIVDGRYDIVGFDPRGINWTTPSFECTTKEVQKALLSYTPSVLSYHDDEQSYGQTLAFSKLRGLACSQVDSGKYISTALVATDMLYISEALGDEKLNYWGFSYGSVLGNTFAQLYPESVGRMIVDGVCDAEDYYDGKWLANLINSDDVTQAFFDGCVASTRCALNNGLTSDQIKDNFFDFMEKLKKEPVTVFGDDAIGIIDYSLFKGSFFAAMYSPTTWEDFAIKVNDLMKGNGTAFLKTYSSNNDDMFEETGGYATKCGDSSNSTYPSSIDSIPALRDRVSDLQKSTNMWSDFWLEMCVKYTTKPVFLFDGPFEKVDATMLLIGNTYDPVTPLQAARKMSQFYTNGIVLHQDGYGHCSLAQKSICTEKVVRDWFVDGVLPQNNTLCSVDEKLFEHELVIESVVQPFFFGN